MSCFPQVYVNALKALVYLDPRHIVYNLIYHGKTKQNKQINEMGQAKVHSC